MLDDRQVSETFDPANAQQALAAHVRVFRRELRGAAAGLTFVAVENSLAESDLVGAFAASFSSMAFASVEIKGMSKTLARELKSVGNGLWGFLDPYAHRILSSDAMRGVLPELAMDEADPVDDPNHPVWRAGPVVAGRDPGDGSSRRRTVLHGARGQHRQRRRTSCAW